MDKKSCCVVQFFLNEVSGISNARPIAEIVPHITLEESETLKIIDALIEKSIVLKTDDGRYYVNNASMLAEKLSGELRTRVLPQGEIGRKIF